LGYYFFNEEKDLLFSFKENNKNLLENSYPSVFNALKKWIISGEKVPDWPWPCRLFCPEAESLFRILGRCCYVADVCFIQCLAGVQGI
jgi:hypothetical protein